MYRRKRTSVRRRRPLKRFVFRRNYYRRSKYALASGYAPYSGYNNVRISSDPVNLSTMPSSKNAQSTNQQRSAKLKMMNVATKTDAYRTPTYTQVLNSLKRGLDLGASRASDIINGMQRAQKTLRHVGIDMSSNPYVGAFNHLAREAGYDGAGMMPTSLAQHLSH